MPSIRSSSSRSNRSSSKGSTEPVASELWSVASRFAAARRLSLSSATLPGVISPASTASSSESRTLVSAWRSASICDRVRSRFNAS